MKHVNNYYSMGRLYIQGKGKLYAHKIADIFFKLGKKNIHAYSYDATINTYSWSADNIVCMSDPGKHDVVMTVDEFNEKYPYTVGDVVLYEKPEGTITKYIIQEIRWDETTDCIQYFARSGLSELFQLLEPNIITNNSACKIDASKSTCVIDLKNTFTGDKVVLNIGNEFKVKHTNDQYIFERELIDITPPIKNDVVSQSSHNEINMMI